MKTLQYFATILAFVLSLSLDASAECVSFIPYGYHPQSDARIDLNCDRTLGTSGVSGTIVVRAPSFQRLWIRIGENFDREYTPQVVGYVLDEVATVERLNDGNGMFHLDLGSLGLDPNKQYFFEAGNISNLLGFSFYNVISDPGTVRFE